MWKVFADNAKKKTTKITTSIRNHRMFLFVCGWCFSVFYEWN